MPHNPQQLSARTQIHHHVQILLVLERDGELDDEGAVDLREETLLHHDVFDLILPLNMPLLQDLNSVVSGCPGATNAWLCSGVDDACVGAFAEGAAEEEVGGGEALGARGGECGGILGGGGGGGGGWGGDFG